MSYPGDITIKGAQFARLVPVNLTASTKIIASFGTAMDFPVIDMEHPKIANIHEDLTYITKKLTGGDTLKHAENQNAYYAADGSSAPKSDNADSIKVAIGLSYADFLTLKGIWKDDDKRLAACIGYGRIASAETVPAYFFIIGTPLGDLEWDSTEDINTIEIEVKGGEIYTAGGAGAVSDFNTAMAGAVTLLDTSTLTVPSVGTGSGDSTYTDMLAGKIGVVASA